MIILEERAGEHVQLWAVSERRGMGNLFVRNIKREVLDLVIQCVNTAHYHGRCRERYSWAG